MANLRNVIKQVEWLEKENQARLTQIKNIEMELDVIIKKIMNQSHAQPDTDRQTNYLKEVNEQMFQQNMRLREFIETCMEKQKIPDLNGYYEALKEGEKE